MDRATVLVMAAGTGGHVFPALAIAECLRQCGADVQWLGTKRGMEHALLATRDFKLHAVSVYGLRGSGLARLLAAPWMLLRAFLQSWRIIRRVKPDCVLGMGGFVCGPAGVAAKILGRPLLIHEQNAVAGLTNKLLAPWADRVLEAFPNTFKRRAGTVHAGNPIRREILACAVDQGRDASAVSELNILVLGGSQGAVAINRLIPLLLADWGQGSPPRIYHQTGQASLVATLDAYDARHLARSEELRVQAFIDDMAAAYAWSDLVICRSGASTVSELAAIGRPAILIPYPHHRDQQQLLNARWLADAGGALILQQSELSSQSLQACVLDLVADRQRLQAMATAARGLGKRDAAEAIAQQCLEAANG